MIKRYKLGKVAYGATFIVVLPALLVLWARNTTHIQGLPTIQCTFAGAALIVGGGGVMLAGMWALWTHGGGLPMNAFPPPRYVCASVYQLTSHPIYVGFCAAGVGVAIFVGSATGLWLVCPVLMLACAALVIGYEGPDLRRRFGSQLTSPWLRLPAYASSRPTARDIVSIVILVLLPWSIVYESLTALGVAKYAVRPTAGRGPVEIFHAGAYAFIFAAILLAHSRRDLRRFATASLATTAITALVFVVLPGAAFPASLVIWTLLATKLLTPRGRAWSAVAWTLAFLIATSAIATGTQTIANVAIAVAVFLFVTNLDAAWRLTRDAAEAFANSWREWRIGPIRIINHGLYAGLATTTGTLIMAVAAGQRSLPAIVMLVCIGVLGAALWGQFVEGSPRLLRPFGYYGSVVGTVIGLCFTPLLGTKLWLVAGALCLAAPWIQSIGRLRCFVQGCCHGRLADRAVGIRYTHARTRVCRIAEMTGVPIHPTQLYSILPNIAIGLLLARLWLSHNPSSLVCGMYLVLSGLARFVEESYRGEPQTRILAGLPIYQWLAVMCVIAGAAITTIPTTPATIPEPLRLNAIVVAAILGFMTWFAMGVDFPESNRRFSRLA